jgi:Chromo (CHRromatin Organisation MOdifier) domain
MECVTYPTVITPTMTLGRNWKMLVTQLSSSLSGWFRVNRNGGDLYFKVRWFGYDPEEDTWELWDTLPEAVVMKYMRKNKMVPTP